LAQAFVAEASDQSLVPDDQQKTLYRVAALFFRVSASIPDLDRIEEKENYASYRPFQAVAGP